MRIATQSTFLLLSSLPSVLSLLAEERGLNDFLIPTVGHRTSSFIFSTGSSVLTSDCPQDAFVYRDEEGRKPTSSCVVASRSLEDGTLNWRRNVCSTRDDETSHVVAVLGDRFYTSDHSGIIRAWNLENGALLWDVSPANDQIQRIWAFAVLNRKVVASSPSNSGTLTLRNGVNGRTLKTIEAADLGMEGPGTPRWLYVMPHSVNGKASLLGVAALISTYAGKPVATGEHMTLVEMSYTDDGLELDSTTPLKHNRALFAVSTIQVQKINDEWNMFAIGTDGRYMTQFSLQSSTLSLTPEFSDLHPLWTSVTAISSERAGVIRLTGEDNRHSPSKLTSALYRFDGEATWDQWYGIDEAEETEYETVAYCSNGDVIVVVVNSDSIKVYTVDIGSLESARADASTTHAGRHSLFSPLKELTVHGEAENLLGEVIASMSVVRCEATELSVLVSTYAGTTNLISLSDASQTEISAKTVWSNQDGLGSVSAALFVDAGHSPNIAEVLTREEEAKTLAKLGFLPRLESQVQVAPAMFSGLFAPENRDEEFGFVKVAVLMSQEVHKIWGVPTTGNRRGEVAWTLSLRSDAKWHTMVHGTGSSAASIQGINGGTPGTDILVLSSLSREVAWTCLDGATGATSGNGTVSVPSSIVQVIPLFGGETCRQVALLLHEDQSLTLVPNDEVTKAAVKDRLQSSKNGMYSHVVDRTANTLKSVQLVSKQDDFETRLVGFSSFPGESIVSITYPQRDEVVQSPSTVLGDDSLLLKYLNPHMAVVITTSEETEPVKNDLLSALARRKNPSAGKRKPAGVGQPSAVVKDTTSVEEPNLFVNVMDTVSGRVLYRTSHVGAKRSESVPCVINENWVVYAYFNENSRRTELGVLTLFEGMIDKAGLTAFSSPEQTRSFSSMEPRDSKPVVLSKTYTIVKPVTALGVTSTRAGISTRHIVVASADDKLTSIARELLEPRRPTGEVKKHEKEEGLFQYAPLVPLITLTSPSYNQTIQGVTGIISSATALESQSVVLAYGGPDIFFARVSPSKGFDLLPQSFNRALLSIVTVGLVVVLVVSKIQSERKSVKLGWT